MYESFYGLTADPFRLSTDHRFCFNHRSYARAKAYVQYALHRAEGFVMVTGRPGTGKTTLIQDLLESLPRSTVVVGTLVSTQLGAEDLLRMTAYAFGLDSHAPQKAMVLQRLMDFLNQQHLQKRRTLLIIDEAQDLALSALEELRLLTNLQRSGQPMLQVVLIGQEALRVLIHKPEMEQVHQRLIAAWHLEPLSAEETVGYVRHRLERAGWRGDPAFEPGVLPVVHAFSEGVPRRVNLICSRLLLHGFISESHSLGPDDAELVAHELAQEELASPDYEDGADGSASARPDATVWSEIDQGLYGAAPREEPEPPPAAAPEEPPAIAEVPVSAAAEAPAVVSRAGPEADSLRAGLPTIPPLIPTARQRQRIPVPAQPAPVPRARRRRRGGFWMAVLLLLALLGAAWMLSRAGGVGVLMHSTEQGSSDVRHLWEGARARAQEALGSLRGTVAPAPDELPPARDVAAERLGAGSAPPAPEVASAATAGVSSAGARAATTVPPEVSRDEPVTDSVGAARMEMMLEPAVAAAPEAADDPASPADGDALGEAVARPEASAPASSLVPDAITSEPDSPRPSDEADGSDVGEASTAADASRIALQGQVLFGWNSTEVAPGFDGLLDQIADRLNATDEAIAEIVGYSDPYGQVDYNQMLSLRRAQAVASALADRGVVADRLTVEGRGPRAPVEETGEPADVALARMVEITVRAN